MTKSNICLIVAAGSGARFGSEIPKQYLPVSGGKSSLRLSCEVFIEVFGVENVYCVIDKNHENYFQEATKGLNLPLPIAGGERRQDSVLAGLAEISKQNPKNLPKNVFIHDAARPFISKDLIQKIALELDSYQAVIPACVATDTIKFVENNFIDKTIDRNKIYLAQTPQAFDFVTIYDLHKKYNNTDFTDDAQLCEMAGIAVKIVESDKQNKKITFMEDMNFVKKTRVGSGFDVHQFEDGDGVILCGIKIPYHKKLKGHSDADAAFHALTDAILGACGEGDIGEIFPDTDVQWKGADSAIFLRKANEILKSRGGSINNVDITIMAQAPKMKDYKNAMKENTAKILNLDISQVNIKATTTEELGFVGRKEGLAASAVVAIEI